VHGYQGVGKAKLIGQIWARAFFALMLTFVALFAPATMPANAAAGGDRTLYLHHTHTKATGKFTFRKNGNYDQKVLRELNVFLADWRTKEPTKMDPALFDLLWTVYQEVGGRQPINIVSSYRSPKTNKMLASKSSGVADNSQHMKGKAIDFFIPGVDLFKLRATAMKHQVGGVGYYPTSGSPFVHLDTGSVRAWPRMTTAQLKKVFPDGKTLHISADGKVLSAAGRKYAEAEWNKCRQVPCSGMLQSELDFAVAANDAPSAPDVPPVPATRGTVVAEVTAQIEALDDGPSQRSVSTISVAAPVPAQRPLRDDAAAVAVADAQAVPTGTIVAGVEPPIPAVKSQQLLLATGPSVPMPQPEEAPAFALAAIETTAPAPRVLMTDREIPNDIVTAYAAPPSPEAQRALEMIIARETTAALPAPAPLTLPVVAAGSIRTAAVGPTPRLDTMGGMLDLSFSAITSAGVSEGMSSLARQLAAAHPAQSLEERDVELTAPDFEHIADTMVLPVLITSAAYADLYEPDEAPTGTETELGPMMFRLGLVPDTAPLPVSDRFVTSAQLLIASN